MKRDRKRYVKFKLHASDACPDRSTLVKAMRKSLMSLYGEVLVADSKLFLTVYDPETGDGVVGCTLSTLEEVISAASLLFRVGDTYVSFEPIKTSGTLKALGVSQQ